MKIFLCKTIVMLTALTVFNSQALESPQKNIVSDPSTVRIDVPLTAENSYMQDFGHGVILRLPKNLSPGFDFSKRVQPIKAEATSMTFWYPDLIPADWVSTMDKIFENLQKRSYVSQKDRFRVNVIWMFYSPGEYGNTKDWGNWQMEPRPPQIDRNRHCYKIIDGHCVDDMRRIKSGIAGIDVLIDQKWLKAHPESAHHNLEKGGSYFAQPDAPYELVMDCGFLCLAHVYSKKYHFQYRMQFPGEAVVHTDELIRSIDKLLDQWSQK